MESSNIWKPGDKLPENMSIIDWITPTLAVGPVDQACDSELMKLEGIKQIISIGSLYPTYLYPEVGIGHMKFPDIEDASPYIPDEIINILVKAIVTSSKMHKTFVHCAAGVSRSPGFITLALAKLNNLSWEEAKQIVYTKRKVANIHPVTEYRLKRWLDNK